MNLKTLETLAASLGATVEEDKIYPPYSIVVIAPDGKQWVDGECVHMQNTYHPHFKGDRADAIKEAYNRVLLGLEDYDEEINGEL